MLSFLEVSADWIKPLITIGIIIIVAGVIDKVLRLVLNRYIERSSKTLNVDPTKYRFLKNAQRAIIMLLALVFIFNSIPGLKNLGLSLFASAGIFAAILGFASQQAFSNIISGIFIVTSKPFRVGDIIKIGDLHSGVVEDITLRHTVIRNFENRRFVIPNSVISSQTIENSSIYDPKICNFIFIGISYDSNIDSAISIIQEEAQKHPDFLDNRSAEDISKKVPPVVVRVIGFGDSSVNLRASVWSKDAPSGFAMKCDLHKSIKERFDREGIEIPFPYRTLIYKSQPDKTILPEA